MPLNCKSCGAPLKGDEEHCPYCGSLIDYGDGRKQKAENRKKPENLPAMKYVSGVFIIIISFLTRGLYGIYWYLSRRGSLNELADGMKFPDSGLAVYIIAWAVILIAPESAEDLNVIAHIAILGSSFYVAFSVKKILREYASHHFDAETISMIVAPSNVALFFFGYIYIQFQINKMINAEILAPKL